MGHSKEIEIGFINIFVTYRVEKRGRHLVFPYMNIIVKIHSNNQFKSIKNQSNVNQYIIYIYIYIYTIYYMYTILYIYIYMLYV